jgi:hypothetical protein
MVHLYSSTLHAARSLLSCLLVVSRVLHRHELIISPMACYTCSASTVFSPLGHSLILEYPSRILFTRNNTIKLNASDSCLFHPSSCLCLHYHHPSPSPCSCSCLCPFLPFQRPHQEYTDQTHRIDFPSSAHYPSLHPSDHTRATCSFYCARASLRVCFVAGASRPVSGLVAVRRVYLL